MNKEYEYKSNIDSDIVVKVNDEDVKITSHISLENMIEIVERVVSNCFTEDGAYIPVIKDFLYRAYVIAYYSDIKLPDTVEEQYKISVGTNLYDIVSENVCAGQLQVIKNEIESCIKNKISDIADRKTAEIEELINRVNDFSVALQPLVQEIQQRDIEKNTNDIKVVEQNAD